MNKICGQTKEAIRRAYFSNSLDKLLDIIQAEENHTDSDFEALSAYLESLEGEKKKRAEQLSRFGLASQKEPPTVQELKRETDPQKIKRWRVEVEADLARAKKIIQTFSHAADKSAVDVGELQNSILVVAGLQSSIDQDRVYKDQLYRAKLTTIIDKYNVSRKEAEERAKITQEYRDYKLAVLFTENVKDFIMSAKKRIGNNI